MSACLFLDSKNQVIVFEELFVGSLYSADTHPREVVKQVLKSNANAIIVSHNHHSSDSVPSQSDIQITNFLHYALLLIEIKALEHLIISNKMVSLAETDHL